MSITYYIDTDYLHSYVFFKNSALRKVFSSNMDDDGFRYEKFKKILFNRNSDVKIPFIVCGELFNNINRHNHIFNEENMLYINNEIFSLFFKENVDLIPPNKESYNLAYNILSLDTRFDSNDALIVSQALGDENSGYIATSDNVIINSFENGIIAKLNQKLSDEGNRFKRLKIYV